MEIQAITNVVAEQVSIAVELDKFDRMTDRELLLNLNRRVDHFETLFAQMGQAAEKNPMMKMVFGKFLG